jgi:bifunctional non-homologous end joining protein LigD
MALEDYRKKRKFSKTPEPGPHRSTVKSGLVFVVQRHKASRLHYDFRLEMNGVLKSWAVPKGPSLNPADKRLAMMVEDHPFAYKDFAGIIPEGNYGAGIVEIWDHGTLSDIDHSDKQQAEKKLRAGLKSGNLKFFLKGRKLKGEFALVKLKNAEQNAWLLIKHRDEYALDENYTSEAFTGKSSPINRWLKKNGTDVPEQHAKAKKKTVKKATGRRTTKKRTRAKSRTS